MSNVFLFANFCSVSCKGNSALLQNKHQVSLDKLLYCYALKRLHIHTYMQADCVHCFRAGVIIIFTVAVPQWLFKLSEMSLHFVSLLNCDAPPTVLEAIQPYVRGTLPDMRGLSASAALWLCDSLSSIHLALTFLCVCTFNGHTEHMTHIDHPLALQILLTFILNLVSLVQFH